MSNPNSNQINRIDYHIDLAVHLDFPALDHLVQWLESQQQTVIDQVTARIKADTAKTKAAAEALKPPTT